jgi:hypothetical protein
MRNKFIPIISSSTLILAILACNMPGGQSTDQPDLAATITAQAQQLQAASETPVPVDTPAAGETLQPTNPPPQQNQPPPANPPAPSAPSKPKNFKAEGSATSINFSWKDNSTDENGFRIYQEGVSAPIASVNANTGTGGMSYNWSGLACGFKAKFSIRAFNNNGESDSSDSKDGVTVPCAPTNLVLNGQGNEINFNWAVTNPHNEDGFKIYQQGVPAPVASRGPNKGSGGTNFDLTGLACNLVATYYVTAYNSAGESGPTNLAQSETVPCGPSGLTITSTTKDVVTYSWTDNATSETGFKIYIDDVLYATLSSSSPIEKTGSMNNDAAVQCDFNFPVNRVFSIRAFNYAGESTTSEHVGTTIPQC